MNCDDIQKGIYVYLDSELAEPDRLDFEQHVRSCARCRGRVERERGFIAGFRAKVPRVTAPPGLEARIRQALAEAPAPEESGVKPLRPAATTWVRPWMLAAAAVLIATPAVMVWQMSSTPAPHGEERVAMEAVATHRDDLPMEVRGSQRQIRQFLESNVPFKVELPESVSGGDAPELVGARLTRVDGREAVLLNYVVDGERLSVLQVAAPPTEAPAADQAPTYTSQAGFDIATFRKRGVMSSVVGNGGSASVDRLVRAAWKP